MKGKSNLHRKLDAILSQPADDSMRGTVEFIIERAYARIEQARVNTVRRRVQTVSSPNGRKPDRG